MEHVGDRDIPFGLVGEVPSLCLEGPMRKWEQWGGPGWESMGIDPCTPSLATNGAGHTRTARPKGNDDGQRSAGEQRGFREGKKGGQVQNAAEPDMPGLHGGGLW